MRIVFELVNDLYEGCGFEVVLVERIWFRHRDVESEWMACLGANEGTEIEIRYATLIVECLRDRIWAGEANHGSQ